MKALFDTRDRLRGRIDERIRELADKLCRGSAADHAEYKRQVGRIEGLRDAHEAITAVFKRLLEEDENDE